jgi:uncharacterized protein YabN with tetrapyrrole methylase and pyrophosphatase domain
MQIKADDKKNSGESSVLGNVPKSMPALARAQSISRRAAHLGFEWPDIARVWEKVEDKSVSSRRRRPAATRLGLVKNSAICSLPWSTSRAS